MNMSVDGELYSKLVIGDMGVATFDILEDLPQGSVVTFSIADIAWQEENGLEFKLEIPPLVIEVIGMEEKPMTAAKMDVLASATSREITMNAGEWINWDKLSFQYKEASRMTEVKGTINVTQIDKKIKEVTANGYYGTDKTPTMIEISKAKLYIKINDQLISSEGYNLQYDYNPAPLGTIKFEFNVERKIEDSDLITFHIGPDLNSGRVIIDRKSDQFGIYYVNFTDFQTSLSRVIHKNINFSSEAILIDSMSPHN